jgi:iron complex outermembrane receptor protein
MEGQPLGTFFGREFAGFDDQGRELYKDYEVDENGRRTLVGTTLTAGGEDFSIIGNANPDWSLGVTNNATWGRFDGSFLVRAEVGQDVLNNTALVFANKTQVKNSKGFLESALDDPLAYGQPAVYSSRWIENGSFVRLQNVTVGYTFNVPLLRGSPGAATRVYLSGDNLLLLTGYDGYDPEAFTDAGTVDREGAGNLVTAPPERSLVTRGIDYLNYPRARTFTLGARITF